MKAHTFLAMLIAALLFSIISAAPAQAATKTITLDFSGYANGTTIDNVHIPGVTFIATVPNNVTINNGVIVIDNAGAGTDLVIQFDQTITGGRISTKGYELCQAGPDFISWYNDASLIETFNTFIPVDGRCASHSLSRTFVYDAIHIDVTAGQDLHITNISYTVDVEYPASAPNDTSVDIPPSRPGLETGFAPGLIIPLDAQGNEDHVAPVKVAVYGINGENGYLAFVVTADEIAAQENWPTGTPYASSDDGKLNFYILGDNECQVNIGPDSEGKVQEIVFSCDTFTFIRRSEFNVNTVFED